MRSPRTEYDYGTAALRLCGWGTDAADAREQVNRAIDRQCTIIMDEVRPEDEDAVLAVLDNALAEMETLAEGRARRERKCRRLLAIVRFRAHYRNGSRHTDVKASRYVFKKFPHPFANNRLFVR